MLCNATKDFLKPQLNKMPTWLLCSLVQCKMQKHRCAIGVFCNRAVPPLCLSSCSVLFCGQWVSSSANPWEYGPVSRYTGAIYIVSQCLFLSETAHSPASLAQQECGMHLNWILHEEEWLLRAASTPVPGQEFTWQVWKKILSIHFTNPPSAV